MRTKNAKILFIILGLSASAWAGWEGYRFVARSLGRSAQTTSKRRIAVMGFTSETGGKSRASAIVTERLTSEISATPGLEVVERGRLDEVLKEQKLGARGVLDPVTAKKIGNILGADAVVTGTVIELNNTDVEINARLVDTQDAHILKAVTKTVKKDWEEKTSGWSDFNFDMNIDLDAPIALLPAGFMDEEVCRKLEENEAALVRSCVELRARKIAYELKTGALKLSQLKKNPGSEINNADLKRQFYLKMKEWYYSSELRPLTSQEEDLVERISPQIEKYPCR
ncbi:MAG: hypothetical protein A2234_03860 [Elusimicrobia bacterium RIFOXYA2_FULL_58_8]|nr:MAG: hypothetical protein A2285_04895 [Elusimicrobia bacterium RIFOXYA12_FULL_57_11]OGS13532.1 MAG: hypothetical protein A2234_03860 [Elusimicrobia bacterium RIFOXYA2_FULL_58_8]